MGIVPTRIRNVYRCGCEIYDSVTSDPRHLSELKIAARLGHLVLSQKGLSLWYSPRLSGDTENRSDVDNDRSGSDSF